jgi:hypothetical protein
MDRADERSHFEAVGDICYSSRYFHLQARLFGKIDGLFKLISVVAGSSAFAGFLSGSPKLAGIAALVTAVITALDVVWSPGSKHFICTDLSKRYTALERRGRRLSLEDLDDEIWTLREIEAPAIEALRIPAYNDSVVERGLESQKLTTTWWQDFVAFLA